jgi:mRNA interferase RelE/StbE
LAWEIEFSATATKQLSKLGVVEGRRITAYLRQRVAGDPRAMGKALTGPMGGLWRYRVGDYRVICDIQDGSMRVLVIKLGHRGEVYR